MSEPIARFLGSDVYICSGPDGIAIGYSIGDGGAIAFEHGDMHEACRKTIDALATQAWYRFLQQVCYDGDDEQMEADMHLLYEVWLCPGVRIDDPVIVRGLASLPGSQSDLTIEQHQRAAEQQAERGMRRIRERWPCLREPESG